MATSVSGFTPSYSCSIKPICWRDDHLQLLDQRLLPQQVQYVTIRTVKAAIAAIRDMAVRGAPAIGITAAYAVVLAAQKANSLPEREWHSAIEQAMEQLATARPTAVNLNWALARMKKKLNTITANDVSALWHEAHRIHQEQITSDATMADLGSAYLVAGSVLTHCNTGALATGGIGTALGVIRRGFQQGKIERVFCTETRPWLQGARLTTWELIQDKIPATLIVDSSAAQLMSGTTIQWLIVGADRIAANGDVANKIGTYSLAVIARHFGVRVMVVAPTSTIDSDCATGAAIPIEYRAPEEICRFADKLIAPEQCKAWNPAFDVTPASLIDLLVTEQGVIFSPDTGKIAELLHCGMSA